MSYPVLAGRLILIAGVVFLATVPFTQPLGGVQLATEFLTMLTLALMWNLLAGYADIVTVGQHAFVGVGAYAFFGFLVFAGLGPWLSLGLAGLVALAFALPVMAIVFRLRAGYMAVGSWVVAETLMLAAGKLSAFGGGSGVSIPVPFVKSFGASATARYHNVYWAAFGLAVVAFLATWLLMRSRVGVGLTAMRDSEEGAGAIGVNVRFSRILCFLWTAPFLGVAGGIITMQKLRVAPPASFSILDWTVYVIFVVVIGGIGSFEGPIIGTVVFFLLREFLADLGVWHLIVLGFVSIAVVLIEPRGLWQLIRRFLPDDCIPVGHGPSGPKSDNDTGRHRTPD
jgi:branched-chain amino acid transport system permease protein